MEDLPRADAAARLSDASPSAARQSSAAPSSGQQTPAPPPQHMPEQAGLIPQPMPAPGVLQQQQQGQSGQPRYCKFFMQRVTTNVAHVLFYVVDEQGYAKLAVVGTDVKLSGHFVYASVSDMTEAPPLRCTNRGKVMEWLAALGAATPADDHEVMLPDLAPHHWQQLHSADPMWSKPALDRPYTGYREEVGTLPDGRHFKNYYLVDDAGGEKLMVMAEDGARLDRRYTYKAVEDVGGFCFENGKAVTDWLDYVLGKSEQPPSFMRRDAPPERKRRMKKGDRDTPDRAHGRANKDARTQGYAQAPGPMMQLLEGSFPAANTPAWANTVQQPGDPMVQQQRQLQLPLQYPQLQQQQLGRVGSGYAEAAGGVPYAAAAAGHAMGAQLPPGYAGMQQQQQQLGPGPRIGGGAAAAAPGGAFDGNGLGVEEPLSPRSMQEAVAAAGMEVRAVFSTDPDLLDWVTSMPDGATVEKVRQFAMQLDMCVNDSSNPPNLNYINEAYQILHLLCQTPVSLRLLELTGICRPVAMLSYNAHPQLREVATRLTQRWRRVATAAHDCASAALKAPMGAPLGAPAKVM